MDDLLSEFLTETSESLESLDLELVKLEQNPNDPDLLGSIFRLVHTIKGTCGFIGLSRLEAVAHAGENVLGNFREGIQEVTPDAVSLILEALDRIKLIMTALEETEAEPEGDDADLIARLDAMYRAGKTGGAPVAEAKAGPVQPAAAEGTLYQRLGGVSLIDAVVEVFYRKVLGDPDLNPFFEGVNMALLQGRQVEFFNKVMGGPDEYGGTDLRSAHKRLVEKGLNEAHFDKAVSYLSAALTELEVPQALIEEVLAVVATAKDDVLNTPAEGSAATEEETAMEQAEQTAEATPAAPAVPDSSDPLETVQAKESAVANQSIRVNVDLLENLMTIVSELVLTRNQLNQMVRKYADSEFKVPLQRLSHVTTDLQEGVMKTRMQPIGNAWGKLPRIVRDLALEVDKKIELVMRGSETELDRQVLELIKDPLTHMIRNSADHGLETPADRVAAGKPELGQIMLNAYHEGGHIVIMVSDDGRGIDIDKVKAKIVEKGLATVADLENMADQQILQFIFRAGFSTAETVTAVSGRGVGMDVVRTNIEKIGGQIELRSTVGKGSIFTIKIPLTLAIVSALIVECRGERFAIPQLSVVELVRITPGSEHRIEAINDTPVLRLRDRLLPLVSLGDLLKLEAEVAAADIPAAQAADEGGDETAAAARQSAADEPHASRETDETFIVVAQVGTYSFGIIVDRVFDTEEIVVKPVAPILRDIPFYSGNTILGDGSVIMILDPNGIAAASGEITMAEQAAAGASASADSAAAERVAFLVFRAGGEDLKAVPLALVARLEEIERSAIEHSNGVPVVQYRGQLMPLLPVDSSVKLKEEGRQPVLVFTDRDRSMGLLVDEIVDIVEDRMNIELSSETEGVLGSAVLAGKATDIIDASAFLTKSFGDWFGSHENLAETEMGGRPDRVLLVDDSPFFRNLLSPLLTVAGYRVTTVESADEALALRESGQTFDIIVSDIEMPGKTGYDLVEMIKAEGPWQNIPVVALTSHTSPASVAKGRAAGFNDYVPKLDRDGLLQSLSQTLTSLRGAA